MKTFRLPGACFLLAAVGMVGAAAGAETSEPAAPAKIAGAKPRNVVLIVADDHRFDALGCAGHPFLQTPRLDALAAGGVRVKNAFVTTSLCSPSRASILSGLYAHRHRVIDNNNPVPPGLVFFPQYLQQAGYATAFVGKWHMGSDNDAPQPGFDHWVSFKGQGTYWPNPDGLNVDGKPVPQKGYLTDELTDYSLDWLAKRPADKPFFLYLAHKAVHGDLLPSKNSDGKREGKLLLPGVDGAMGFVAAPRHEGRYADAPFTPPESMALTDRNYADKPMWVRNRRNSRHGVELPFGNRVEIPVIYRQYVETLLSVDESVGRIVDELRRQNVLDSTLVIYMGDNGYAWGEHGMVDKRSAYEESMRIPLIVHCPELIAPGADPKQMIANIDIGPTVLAAAGLEAPAGLDGRSFLPLLAGERSGGRAGERVGAWREQLLYEYYWEWNFPMTPTIHALRTDRYKLIRPYGLWDVEELYDLEADPHEITNLINDPQHRETVARLKRELFARLKETGGMTIPLFEDRGGQGMQRAKDGTPQAPFPERFLR